ncbi:MAG: hypothetical protein QOC71_1940 [Thermoplasmata archaeon]|nr:hypothetical protein [Thermoplasmata archaeon]
MRSWLAAGLFLVALLSGCSQGNGAEPAAADGIDVITDPRDTAYLQNGSMAAGSHIHDYWGGRDRVTVLDAESGGSASCSGCTDGMVFQSRRPDEGLIVPQGTAWVNGTFTHTSDGKDQFSGFELWVKTAMDSEPKRWGPLESGVPFSINTTQGENDPPHYVLSLWVFQVKALGGDDIHVGGTYTWKVEAVRGLPLIPYPPHPDRWNGATELDLLSDSGGTELTYEAEIPTFGTMTSCYSGCPGRHILPNGAVIPFDTDHVEVTVRITGGAPAGLGLSYHGADTWSESKAAGVMSTGTPGETLFTIPIEGSMADSPYAPQSLWEFQVWMDQPQPNLHAWSGEYTIGIKAFKDAQPA